MKSNWREQYEELLDVGQQFSAELDVWIEANPDDEELKEIQEYLAERCHALTWPLRLLRDD